MPLISSLRADGLPCGVGGAAGKASASEMPALLPNDRIGGTGGGGGGGWSRAESPPDLTVLSWAVCLTGGSFGSGGCVLGCELGNAGTGGTAICTPLGVTKNILFIGGGVLGGLGPAAPFGGGAGIGIPSARALRLPCGRGGNSGRVKPNGPIVPGSCRESSEKPEPVKAGSGSAFLLLAIRWPAGGGSCGGRGSCWGGRAGG
mmetsp:Transcript_65239/g.152688  ORF Transcript_65239/g.152688 Transcript_65239/m.152688 type:complete len:203 (-) Transcript_65239:120-728(-)